MSLYVHIQSVSFDEVKGIGFTKDLIFKVHSFNRESNIVYTGICITVGWRSALIVN